NIRPVREIIEEAVWIRDHYPLSLIYMQDDIFGYNLPWLEEFARRWREEVRVPIHAQIRLELTRNTKRLDLFREAGLTGITLAIEHGDPWMRQYVLHRPMIEDLIDEGIQKLYDREFTLRTEQIYAVTLSDIQSDLTTLEMNVRLNPTMMWTSILAPYQGTEMGDLASALGVYRGNNDDLSETFFERSVLTQVAGGKLPFEDAVISLAKDPKDNPLLRMKAHLRGDLEADVFYGDETKPLVQIQYLDRDAGERYRDQTVMLQRLSYWLSKVHQGHELAAEFLNLPSSDWTWPRLGEMTGRHLDRLGLREQREGYVHELTAQYGSDHLPGWIRENPYYFAYMPAGAELAKVFEEARFTDEFDWRILGTHTRHHLFHYGLYLTKAGPSPIVTR
ncbi:MAG: hypothetical protein AAB903_03140, partial [Patescibacteria group bacterium]